MAEAAEAEEQKQTLGLGEGDGSLMAMIQVELMWAIMYFRVNCLHIWQDSYYIFFVFLEYRATDLFSPA